MNTSGIDLILRSIDLALDRRKLTLAFAGILLSAIGSGIFVWAVQQVSDSLALSAIFSLFGLLVAWVVISLFAGAITQLSYGDLAGWSPRGLADALLSALQHLPSLLFAPLLLGLASVGVLLMELVLMLLGRIPYLGELLVAVLFLPAVLLNALMFVIVFAGTWLVYPVAMGENAGVLQTLRRVIDITRRNPARILTYLGMTVILSLLLVVVLLALAFGAYVLTLMLTVAGMSLERALQMGLSNILGQLGPLVGLMGPMGGLLGSPFSGGLFGGTASTPPLTMDIAGALIGLETALLWLGAIWAVPWVFNLTASCAVFQSVAGQAPAPRPAPAMQPAAWSPPVPYNAPSPVSPPYAAQPVQPVQPAQPIYPAPAQPARVPTSPMQPPQAPLPAQPASQVYTPPPYARPQRGDEAPTFVTPPKPPVAAPPPVPPVAAPRVCRVCGKPLASPNSRFCQACGAKQ